MSPHEGIWFDAYETLMTSKRGSWRSSVRGGACELRDSAGRRSASGWLAVFAPAFQLIHYLKCG